MKTPGATRKRPFPVSVAKTAKTLVHEQHHSVPRHRQPFDEYERRDVKGLYKRAGRGIRNFTGGSTPYEAPTDPQLIYRDGSLC